MKNQGRITMMQAILLFLTMIYSATTRVTSHFTISTAKQAAWLSPTVSMVFMAILFFIIYKFIIKYPNEPFADIICKIVGKPIGKIIICVYIVWFLILLSLYVRYFGERLQSSIYPNADIRMFILIILAVVGFVLRSGFVVLARMNKLIFTVLAIQFFLIILFLISKMDTANLLPLSSKDISPLISSMVGTLGIWVYVFFLFMASDKIIPMKNMKKHFWFSGIFIWFASTLLICVLLGLFGAATVNQLPLPLLTAVKNISTEYSGFESLFLSIWILADFVTISLFAYLTVQLLKSLFGLNNPTPLLSILMVFIYFLSQFLSNEVFELQEFSSKLGVQMNVIMGLGLPIVFFLVGKMRKKL